MVRSEARFRCLTRDRHTSAGTCSTTVRSAVHPSDWCDLAYQFGFSQMSLWNSLDASMGRTTSAPPSLYTVSASYTIVPDSPGGRRIGGLAIDDSE